MIRTTRTHGQVADDADDDPRQHPGHLLVEDDETVRDAVSMILERAGYGVTQAENGLVAAD